MIVENDKNTSPPPVLKQMRDSTSSFLSLFFLENILFGLAVSLTVLKREERKKNITKMFNFQLICFKHATHTCFVMCFFRVGGVVERGAAKLYPLTEVALSLILLFGKRTKLPSEAPCLIARSSKAM